MKRIGILSDTHSVDDPAIERHIAGVDEIWHAGDIGDIDTYRRLENIAPVFRAVSGNIDGAVLRRGCPEVLTFETDGCRVLMTHIGGYPGKYAPGVRKLIEEFRPKIFISGHSHILRVMPDPAFDLLHINPGAAGTKGWHKVRTLVRLTIDRGVPSDLEVIELANRQLR